MNAFIQSFYIISLNKGSKMEHQTDLWSYQKLFSGKNTFNFIFLIVNFGASNSSKALWGFSYASTPHRGTDEGINW